MLNIFKKFLRDSLKGSEATRVSGRRRRRSRTCSQAAEPLETKALLTASLEHFLTTEHVDINLQRSGTEWSLGPRDSDTDTQYANDEAVLYAGTPSVLGRPSGSEFDFIGVNAGQNFYVLPASQDPDLLYLGFAAYGLDSSVDRYNPGTESKGRATGNARYAKASLTGVRHSNPNGTAGTGQFSMWQSGSFGGAVVFMSSFNDGVANPNGSGLDATDGISADDAMWILAGGHSHFNFGFTQTGRYEVDLKLSAYFGDDGLTTPNAAGFSQSNDITVYFSVISVGQLQFEASTYSVNEGAGTASIDVVRVGGSDGRIAVNYATSNGTATAGSDYTSTSGTLEFLDGETRRTITVPILEDVLFEGDQNFNVVLSAPTPTNLNEYIRDVEGDANGLIGTIGSAVVTIIDNDVPPTISDITNKTTPEDVTTSAIPFTVGDDATPASSLVVTATSSNTTLVPNGNIVLGGSGANRTVTITPVPNQFGSTTITLTVTDEIGLTATDTFVLNVTSVNDLPTISDVGNQSINQNMATSAIAFTVGDVETAAGALAVTATSSNATLVPNGNIVIGGSGANRTVTVTPATNQSGSATITLTVTDGDGESSTDTFVVNVNAVNSAPTISNVSNQSTDEDTATGATAFTIGDGETAAGSLVVTATSSNTTLVPNGNIALGGSGANRTVTVTPAANLSGSTTITLTVTDAGGLTDTDTFVLTVSSVNDLPTISDIGNQSTQTATSVGPIGFTIGDVETAAASLTVAAGSSNTALLPLSGIVIAGSGANRTVTLTPEAGQTGSATVTLTVTDADGGSRSDTFELVVTANSAPTISDIANRFVVEGASTGAIAFTVGDVETAAGDLVVTATSSNQLVIPNANIVLGGSGANRTILLMSVLDQIGSTTITVTATDAGGRQASDAFLLTVTANGLVPFTLPVNYGGEFGTSRRHVAADFDGDGVVDIVNSGDSLTKLTFLKGNGGATFLPETRIDALPDLWVGALFAIDFDSDGDKDILAGQFDSATFSGGTNGEIAVYLNNGTAQFTRQVLFGGLTSTQTRVMAADLNADGRPDLIQMKNLNTLVYHESLAGGGFAAEQVISSAFTQLSTIHLEDIDADGDLDILAYNAATASRVLSIFKNDSVGNFGTASTLAAFAAASNIQAVADITGDGLPDIIAAQTSSPRDAVYYPQNANGTFGSRVLLTPALGTNIYRVIPADVNQDGVVDLITSRRVGTKDDLRWSVGRGNAVFGAPQILEAGLDVVNNVIVTDLDGDLDPEIVSGTSSTSVPIKVFKNQTGENPMLLIPPASRSYVSGDNIDMRVHFGFPIVVTGTPRIALQIGANVRFATYLSGTTTSTLNFRYTVAPTDVDPDGIQLVSNSIDLNGGTMVDPESGNAVLTFPNVVFNGVGVNAVGPLVQEITRLDPRSSTTETTRRFNVRFAEPVTGVDVSDFSVVMNAGDLSASSVTSVSGSGDVYEVTVSTGTGSGTLGLSVNGSASIFDLNGDVLGKGFVGGEVYTVRKAPLGEIDTFYTNGHGDYRAEFSGGEFSYVLETDPGVLPNTKYASDEVYTYADSNASLARPASSSYDFLGVAAGSTVYVLPTSNNPKLPYVGLSGDNLVAGTFASYVPVDSRITSTTPVGYVKVQMVGMRSSSGGEFSAYSVVSGNPVVWIASSDGLSSSDNFWLSANSHSHIALAFSKPGIYEVDVVISGFVDSNANGTYDGIKDQYAESGIKTMVFNVDTLGARNDAFTVSGQEVLRGSVTLNDDWDNGIGAYTASVQSTTTKGVLSLQPNGSFTYQPSATFDGSDSFTYRLTNPRGGFTTATVTITGSTRPDFDAVLKSGHTDIGVNFEDDAWDLHIHDEETDAEYEPDEALLYVGRDAMLTRSGDSANAAYDFLGAPVGSTLFVLPQVENANLPFLGIGGEELADGLLEGDVASLRLASVSGPGHFSIWQSGLTPTTPNLIMATFDGIDATDVYDVAAGSHSHMNFAFTKQGFYEVTFVASGIDADGNATDSGQVTYYFNVTDGLVPFSRPNVLSPGLSVSGFQSQLADFNGDGHPDLMVAGSGANALGYRQGLGDGSFLAEQGLNVGLGLSGEAIVAVDYDSDGDQDLVALEYVQSVEDTGRITLYRNNGAATFTRIVLRSDLPNSYQVSAGDLNADGRPDLVYGKGATAVAYVLQQSNGELGAETILSAAFTSTSGLLLGDMNNDGDLDVVVGNRANGVNAYFSVFSNDGNGVFSAPQNKTTGIFPDAHQLVDMNGDGRLDVVTGESVAGSRAGYYPQLSDGTFGSRVVILPTNTQLNSIRVADINGDGIPDIVAGAIVSSFSLLWSPGLGGGAFGPTIRIDPGHGNLWSLQVGDLDGDGYSDIATTGTATATLPSAVKVYINKTGENPMVLLTPAARTRVAGDPIDLDVYFGFPITVTGSPRIALQVGTETRFATYLSGSGTPTLKFRYLVTNTDVDLDGVQLGSNIIDLNGGTLTDPLGGAAVLEFPNEAFSGVFANGAGPLVSGITRLDSRSTDAASVRFRVQFNEDVTGVDAADFDVVMNAGDLSGATIQSIVGSGSLYEVTVSTGTGSGTLGLSIKGTASILDLSGVTFARAFAGGEVYTVRKAPLGELDIYYTDGHADYRPVFNNGEFSYVIHGDAGVLPEIEHHSDEVYTFADSNALVNRPTTANYNFLGVNPGSPVYVLPSTQNVNLPFLGLSGESLVAGQFAAYRPTEDPRITSATIREYVKVQMVGMRSSSGGEFSLYSGTAPTVWMATSDGISDSDSFWLYRTHFHRNLAFSKPGIYEVDVVISGYLDSNGNGIKDPTDVYVESGIKTMVFNIDTLGAVNDAVTVYGSRPVHGNVTLNDEWHDGLGAYALSLVTTTTKGTLTLQPNGAYSYVPSASFDGTDSFVYRLTNPRGGITTGTVSITSAALPDFDAVLTEDHADIGVALGAHDHDGDGGDGGHEDPEWDLHVHDEETDTEYHPDEVLLYVGMDAITTRPADAAYNFTGVAGGESLFVLPPSETPGLLFLGFGTEEIADGTLLGGSLTLRLKSVSGPGHFSIWVSTLGGPDVGMATFDGITEADFLTLLENGHAHFNLGFTEMGMYQITFQAIGTLADGDVIISEDVTYFFKVGNTAEAIDVQNGMTQRSYIRNLDVLFGSDDGLDDILANPGRVQITKFDLNGNNGSLLPGSAFGLSMSGNRLKFDFGLQGLGGNRNTNAGDGYYRVGIDADGDGQFETFRHFYRLLGDVNGDRKVDAADRTAVMAAMRNQNREADVNGDGIVNSVDQTLVTRAVGRKLKDDLFADD